MAKVFRQTLSGSENSTKRKIQRKGKNDAGLQHEKTWKKSSDTTCASYVWDRVSDLV